MMEEDGSPSTGPTNYQLGVRTNAGAYSDVEIDAHGNVHPGTGGMSVSPDHPEHLPFYRRPAEWKGKATWRYPVWAISAEHLGPDLAYRPSEDNPSGHGYIEPAFTMPFDRYREALEATRPHWDIVVP
jgi:hypothetical protein